MEMDSRCPECGGMWHNGMTCQDHFHQMLAWEFENPGGAGAVHHLSVLCYNLQHPSVYSPQALHGAKAILARYVVDGATPQQIRAQHKQSVDSGHRAYTIRGTPESQGGYAYPVNWTITIGDVTSGGLAGYCERVEVWSGSVYEALVNSGNYTPLP
ncbi:MAG: hypothetical protein H6672_16170 [Anaerolineaceae bacterium]|nr:hypothetical protein [Anaerolineaceae bacterium]